MAGEKREGERHLCSLIGGACRVIRWCDDDDDDCVRDFIIDLFVYLELVFLVDC